MSLFLEQYLLCGAGLLLHFLKMWYSAVTRKDKFITQKTVLFCAINIISAGILIYIGRTLPPEILVMSPITCVLIGFSGSSMLAGVLNTKRTKTAGVIYEEETTILNDEGDDTGGSNPPPNKPKPGQP